MKKKNLLLLRLVVLVTAMMCTLGAAAAEAYACYTPENTTLTFYYDDLRSSRTGTTYDLNTGNNYPDWQSDARIYSVKYVVFDPSFVGARPTTTLRWFNEMQNLQSIEGMSYLNTSEVTNMSEMFSYCTKLTSLDLSGWNTSKVTNMGWMFYGCANLSVLDLRGWNTSNVTGMKYMFYECANLSVLDLRGWNTSNVTEMSYMFYKCNALENLDLSHFNTANVTLMSWMFYNCSGLTSLDLSGWNTSKVTNMYAMFYNNSNLQTIYVGNGWSTAAVTNSTDMFYNCTSLVGGQGTTYSSSNPRDKTYAHIDGGLSNPGYFTAGLEAYACYTPSNTTLTFYYDNQRSSRTGTTYDLNTGDNITGWESDGTNASVTKVVFDSSFAGARPTTTSGWFYGMWKLESMTGMSYLNTCEVTNMSWMFNNCSILTSLDVSHFNTSKVTDMQSMFYNCESLTSLDVSQFNTSEVTDMRYMFYNCRTLTSLDLSHFNTSEVTNMGHMFNSCIKLTSLDLSSFNTSKVTHMNQMFQSCYKLTSLDLSHFNTSKVTDMGWMFDGCTNLRTIYVGNGWSTAAVTTSARMFWNCTSLVGGQGTTYDENYVDKTYAHIDGGPSNPGYFTRIEAYACYTPSNTTLTFYYDSQRSSRTGTTYDLNTGDSDTGWDTDGTNASVTKVVFDPSFASARPTTTCDWFHNMKNLESITGMEYLNTSEVTNMNWMFLKCSKLTSVDVSHFNTSKVTSMYSMFNSCTGLTSLDLSSFNTSKVAVMYRMFYNSTNLRTIYVGNGWSTAAVYGSTEMFNYCTSLVGGMGTTYNASHIDKAYAHIDGGTSNPGYFTAKPAYVRGDVNSDGHVSIADVSALIDYLLSGETAPAGADCNQSGNVSIADVSSLIDYLLSGQWP